MISFVRTVVAARVALPPSSFTDAPDLPCFVVSSAPTREREGERVVVARRKRGGESPLSAEGNSPATLAAEEWLIVPERE